MDVVQKRLSELHPNEKNVRKHNTFQISELKKAIEQFGVIRPIICDENGTILCGHGLYTALMESGAETADCVVLAGLTEKEKKKLMLADNKIYDLGTSDYDMIDAILKEFGQESDFSIPGYDADTLEDLYGIRSVEQSAQTAQNVAQQATYTANDPIPLYPQPERTAEPTPSAHVQQEREQAMARRVIVCPHCGETIEL